MSRSSPSAAPLRLAPAPRPFVDRPAVEALPLALLVQRLAIASFLAVWTSLKFLRPEWMANVYGWLPVDFQALDIAFWAGVAQAILVTLFALGLFRTPVYAAVTLMHATGVVTAAAAGRLWNWSEYPNNLLWTSVATLGALVALFLLRRADRYTLDGLLRGR